MRIIHLVVATPKRCGLYETAHELVSAERKAGYNATIADPKPIPELYPGRMDRGVPVCKASDIDLREADLIVSHSGLDGFDIGSVPVIHVQHGRPHHSYLTEREDAKRPVVSYQRKWSKKANSVRVITFWPEHVPFLENIWGDVPVAAIPPSCGPGWCPGETDYDFEGRGGSPNVVIADSWRNDVDPYWTLNAFIQFAKTFREAKLHIYGLDPNPKGRRPYLEILTEMGNLGVAKGWSDLLGPYRKADLVITPQTIYTRSIREPLACGAQVVSGRDCNPSNPVEFAEEMAHRLVNPRKQRLDSFDPAKTAKGFIEVVDTVMGVTHGT